MSDGSRAAERRERDPARERARRHQAGGADDELPAGLERGGRDEDLVHGPDAHPSGARADHRHSVPGTNLPGGSRPAAATGEEARVRAAREGGDPPSEDPPPGEEPPTERAAADEQSEADAVENPAPPGDDAPTG